MEFPFQLYPPACVCMLFGGFFVVVVEKQLLVVAEYIMCIFILMREVKLNQNSGFVTLSNTFYFTS